MLIIAKGSIETTKSRIDNWYKYRSLTPEIIQDREMFLCDSQDLWTSYLQVAMPKLYKGHRITINQFKDPNPNNFSFEASARNAVILGDIRMTTDYFIGDIWIIDKKNISLGHVLRANQNLMQKAANMFHHGIGLKVESVHILNAENFLHQVIVLLRHYFSQKIIDRVIIHKSVDDLHMMIPKKYLPKDYGGEEKSIEEFKDMYEKEFRRAKTKEILIKSMKMVSNEKLRPNADINEDNLAGSFRKFHID